MRSKYLPAIIVSLVLLLAAPSAVGARNKVDQGDAESKSKQQDIIENYADVYFYAYYEDRLAWSAALCQLNVVGDAWLAAISLTSALAVIDDQDDTLLFPEELFGLERGQGPRIVLDLSAETSDSTCDTSVGPIDIFVTGPSAGFGNPAPLGGSLGEAAAAFNGNNGPGNKIEQDYASSKAKQEDVIRNEGYVYYEYGDDSAFASAVCQANVVGRAALWSVASTSLDATILDGDTLLAPAPPLGGGGAVEAQSVDGDLSISESGIFANLTITNDHTATASCTQPIESITISIGGRQDLPPQS